MIRCVVSIIAAALPCLASGQDAASEIFARWIASGARADLPSPARTEAPSPGCEAPGMPAMLVTGQPLEFVDAGDRIVMRFEEWGVERTVHMDPRNRPAVQDPSPRGVSFGRWSGATLEVFTLYIDYPYFDRRGTRQSGQVTVFERYTPSAPPLRLEWEVSVTDPPTFATPVESSGYFVPATGTAAAPRDCPPEEAG